MSQQHTAVQTITNNKYTNFTSVDETTNNVMESTVNSTCQDRFTLLAVSVGILIVARFLGCVESVTVAGTGLKDEHSIVLSLWYFILGVTVSTLVMILYEDPFLPSTVKDLGLWMGHALSASGVTYFDLLAVQNMDVNVYYITGTFKIPASFILQMTLLRNVTPDANMYLLVTGMVVIFLCSLIMPVYEYFKLRRKTSLNNLE